MPGTSHAGETHDVRGAGADTYAPHKQHRDLTYKVRSSASVLCIPFRSGTGRKLLTFRLRERRLRIGSIWVLCEKGIRCKL